MVVCCNCCFNWSKPTSAQSYPLPLPTGQTGPQIMSFPWQHTQSLPTWTKGNTYMRMLFINYSSAFNTIIPSELVSKVIDLGLQTSTCSWICDFLTGRSQVVRIRNHTPYTLTLNTGAPQGCVLSPLLYFLFTYDCAKHSSNVTFKFDNDTSLASSQT